MRKFGVLMGAVFIIILIAGLYGIIHDQITYSISPEYFTKFKFEQFGFDPGMFGGQRQTVAVIGFLATWWVGLIIAPVLGLLGLALREHTSMRHSIKKGIIIVFMVTLIFGIIGFFRGKYFLTKTGVNWWLPDNLVNTDNFIIVGSIHNYSYLGGGIGLLIAIIYMIRNILSQERKISFIK
jgi:MFS family permease